MSAGTGLRVPGGERDARSCPLCHGPLRPGEELALVPVSPAAWPGVAGLDVHAGCLAAARRGAFELPLPRSPVPALAAATFAVLLLASVAGLRALLPGDGWLVPFLATFLLAPAHGALAVFAAARLAEATAAHGRRTAWTPASPDAEIAGARRRSHAATGGSDVT